MTLSRTKIPLKRTTTPSKTISGGSNTSLSLYSRLSHRIRRSIRAMYRIRVARERKVSSFRGVKSLVVFKGGLGGFLPPITKVIGSREYYVKGSPFASHKRHLSLDSFDRFGFVLQNTITLTPRMFLRVEWYLVSYTSPSLIVSIAT